MGHPRVQGQRLLSWAGRKILWIIKKKKKKSETLILLGCHGHCFGPSLQMDQSNRTCSSVYIRRDKESCLVELKILNRILRLHLFLLLDIAHSKGSLFVKFPHKNSSCWKFMISCQLVVFLTFALSCFNIFKIFIFYLYKVK